MRVLLVTAEAPLKQTEVVSGNAVRTIQIKQALESAGHTVSQTWLSPDRRRTPSSFRTSDELQSILAKHTPDVIIVGYWELLALLPFDLEQEVILDFVAPRSLEELFESPQSVRNSMRRLRLNLERCDAVMVGNEQQRDLLLNTLIEAGFDLRNSNPILVVPLAAEIVRANRTGPGKEPWVMVAGGVNWPWRNPGSYASELEQLAQTAHPGLQIVQFGGSYRWHDDEQSSFEGLPPSGEPAIEFRAMEPYRDYSRFLSEKAHIGIELSEWNVERQFSQSFRSLEFLRHGLPLLCNRFLPLAGLVEEYDAGWLVDEAGSLKTLMKQILERPDEWAQKSENALRLVQEALSPEQSATALLRWLESPRKAVRLPLPPATMESEPVLGVPPLKKRLARQLGLIRQVLLARLFGHKTRGSGVLIVTRSDLFPTDHGAAVRTVETARALSRLGLAVGIVSDEKKYWHRFSEGVETRVPYPLWVNLLSLPGALVKLLHFSKDLPYSNSFLYLPMTDRGFQWRALKAAKEIHAGVLQAEFPAYALPCIRIREALQCSVVLVQHNVEYERIKAQVDELSEAQYENLKCIELNLCNQSDAVVCVSDNDRQKLLMDGVSPELMYTVPHGVNLKHYEEDPEADGRSRFGIGPDDPVLVYHGTFSYPPNREAIRIFAETLLPGLQSKGLDCHLLAVGKSPPATSPHPRIHFTGSVEHVAPWLKVANMAVVPLTDGGGTRMKIIDCFAARLPVISTSKGIEGIPVVAGQHAIIVDEWEAMIEAICDLWEHPEKARKLAQCGREMVDELDWTSIAEKYRSIYAELA